MERSDPRSRDPVRDPVRENGTGVVPDAAAGGEGDGHPRYQLAIFDDCLRSAPIPQGTMVIGRSKRCQLQVRDGLLSRKHCSITQVGGIVTLSDLNSSNGTYVNGSRVSTRVLNVDDIIEIGRSVLVLFDGKCWVQGRGLLELRNPLKAQELVQRLTDGAEGLERPTALAPASAPGERRRERDARPAARGEQRALEFLRSDEGKLAEDLLTRFLVQKLTSLLVRRSDRMRSLVSDVLDELLSLPIGEAARAEELESVIRERVRRALAVSPEQSLMPPVASAPAPERKNG